MNASLNCDQVFEILTRGPFPRGVGNDADVEMHLSCCYECRCLAEALRPAVDLLHESITDHSHLPGYTGNLAEETSVVDRVMQRMDVDENRLRNESSARVATWVVAVAILLCICPTLPGVLSGARDTLAGRRTEGERGAENGSSIDFRMLARSTTDACRLHESKSTETHGKYQCCTYCHAAKERQGSQVQVALVLAQACTLCHSPP